MRRVILALALLLGLMSSLVLPYTAVAQSNESAAAEAALNWMRSQQQPDGSFPGFGPGETADAVLAFAAAGVDPNGIINNGNSPVSYLGNQAGSYATRSVGAASKLTLAVVAAGKSPVGFGGVNLPALIGQSYNASTGQYGADVFSHSLALLAIRSMGATPPEAAVNRLVSLQLADGGWSFDGTAASGSDTNTTALAMQALSSVGNQGRSISLALGYLSRTQNSDGGFAYQAGGDSDANSTALVRQAIAAANVLDNAEWNKAGGTPLSALLALQNSSGAFRYQQAVADDNGLATYQAVPGLLAKPLPVVTTNVPEAQAAIAPAPAPTAPTTPAPVRLPTTGGADSPALPLALLALALLAGGFVLRRGRGRR